ncbi:hypothetical protein [Bradyrhizobium sp. C9]|uniref:hypothetical protein n=1 Tax=Bradyrhizobium sp. C9 TaxID=142585 RepID=UPI000BEC1E69|nr:hypothetical protein [Bradyrhizobium sp. C9]PDT77140.1 hypothetical protein CO675_11270 [Bradyrhizobium sp. C9]
MLSGYEWENSLIARLGNWIWTKAIDPVLCKIAGDELSAFRTIRGIIQIIISVAVLLLPLSLFFNAGHVLTASGLLFDIAGVLRLFLLEEIDSALDHYRETRPDNLPSVAMRELIMPEASGPYLENGSAIQRFYYQKRGVFFLFVGFALQLIGDLVG